MSKRILRHFDRERLIWDARIEAKHKLILLAYNSFLGANDTCWPSNSVIAVMSGIPKSTLIKDLQKMRERQLVVSNPRYLKNKRRSPDKPSPKTKPQASNETVINWSLLESLCTKALKISQSQNETTPQSQNETTPQSQNETTPQSQNETTPVSKRDYPQSQNETRSNSYGSNPGSNPGINKIPPTPQRGAGGVANAFQNKEQELIATDGNFPEEPIAHELDEPEQNTTSQKNASTVKDQSSAPRRRSPSKAIEAIKRQYPNEPPAWRNSYEVGDYCVGFKDFVRREVIQKLPANSIWATYTPAQLIEENETVGKFASLEERCNQWLYAEAKCQAAEAKCQAAEAKRQAQPEEPREMPLDAIARIMQAQGLTPADVVPEVKSEYRAVFNRLPSDPQEAWDLLSRAQLSIVAAFLEKKYATP